MSTEIRVVDEPEDRPRRLRWTVDVDRIDRSRLLRAWTQRELARAARVDQGTLCDLLSRRRHPTLGTLRAVCSALDLALEAVLVFPGHESVRQTPVAPAPDQAPERW